MHSADSSFPLVSIIMPTYNRADYILETIESIQKQTYHNWELIILDDGSTDNTESIVKAINEQRIQYHKFDRCGIVGKLKNAGIAIAKGALLAFMDSDDLWPAEKLEKQVAALAGWPEAGFSITNGYNFSVPGKMDQLLYGRTEGMECSNILERILTGKLGVFTQTLLMRRRCLTEVEGFNEDKPFTDYSFACKLAAHYKSVTLYEPLFFRRVHQSNSSSTNWLYDYAENVDAILESRRNGYITAAAAQDAVFVSYCNMGEICLRKRMWAKAAKSFLNAWKYRPLSVIPAKKLLKTLRNSVNSSF